MRSLLLTLSSVVLTLTLFSGCSPDPKPEQEKRVIDPSLPVVQINGHLNDINAVAFEWKSITDTRVQGVHVYRAVDTGSTDVQLKRIASVEGRYATHFLDTGVEPNTRYQYRFTTYNAKGAESPGSETVQAASMPVIDSVSFFTSIGNMPRSAKLIWRPHSNPKVKSYRIERQESNDAEWAIVGQVEGRLSAEFIDTNLNDNARYRYRIRAVTYDQIVSNPSPVVEVITKPLPKAVKGVTVTTDLPRTIVLTWEASATDDLNHYNIYRSESINGYYEYHVKTRDTRFEDSVKADGATYFYKVTAVDRDGLEGAKEVLAVQGSTLGKPMAPLMTQAIYRDGSFHFQWQNNDGRTASYTLVKTIHESWLSQTVLEITGINQARFTDNNITPDMRYEYQVKAVDRFGIASHPTEAVELSFKAD